MGCARECYPSPQISILLFLSVTELLNLGRHVASPLITTFLSHLAACYSYMCFLWLPKQMATNLVAKNKTKQTKNRNVFPWSSELCKSKVRCQQSHVPSEGYRKQSSLVSFSFWWPQVFLGLWQHNCMLCVCLHMAFSSMCVPSPLFSLIWALIIGYGAHLGNPRWSHLKILNVITFSRLFLPY